MTHEELLRIIQSWIDSPGEEITTWKALRAVVELHEEAKGYDRAGKWIDEPVCIFCSNLVYEYEVPYPCPTIQAIEKELK